MPTAIEREAQAIKSEAKKILLIVVIISLGVYALSGTAQVAEQETGLLSRLGKIDEKTLPPGLRLGYPWPIDKVVRIPTGVAHSLEVKNFNLAPQLFSERMTKLGQNKIFKESLRSTGMAALVNPYLVTADLNVVHVDLDVVYKITDPAAYYLAAEDIQNTSNTNVQDIARKVVVSVLIQTVSQMQVMEALGEGQEIIRRRVKEVAQKQFDRLALGITVSEVKVTNSHVPGPLQEAFNMVTRAMQKRGQLYYEAKAEAKGIEDKAESDVAAIITEARTDRNITIRQAQGDAKRYTDLINKYHEGGEVVRDRLRYEKLAEVAPNFKAPTIHAIPDTQGRQKLVITIPGKPE